MLYLHLLCIAVSADAPSSGMLLLQEAASPVMLSITSLHHEVMYVLLLTLGSVLYLLLRALSHAAYNTTPMFLSQHTLLELI